MKTVLFFVRHAESVYIKGQERTRGLTEKGRIDAFTVRDVLRFESISYFVSSPFERAIETIRPLADELHMEIHLEEDLCERQIGNFTPLSFKEAKYKVYEDFQFAFPYGESSVDAQDRAVEVIIRLLKEHEGKRIVVGTHGDIMTLLLNYFDKAYGYSFWEATTMPDIYKLTFEGEKLNQVKRMWR